MTSTESSPCAPPFGGPERHGYFAFDQRSGSPSVSVSGSNNIVPVAKNSRPATPTLMATNGAAPSSASGGTSSSSTCAVPILDRKPLPPLPQIKITVSPPTRQFNSSDLKMAVSRLPQNLNAAVHSSASSKFINCSGTGVLPISSTDEYLKLIHAPDAEVVVLDLRPFKQYSVSRVKGALSICVPTTLLKRSSFHLSNIFKTMVASQEKILQSKLDSDHDIRVIFYDTSSDIKHCSMHLSQIIKKFQDSMTEYGKNIELYIADRGFGMFEEREDPSLPESESLIDYTKFKGSGIHESNAATHTSFSNFVLPSADPASSFVMSLKSNSVLADTTSTVLRLPGFSAVNELPVWLQRYTGPESVNTIVSNFMTIETMENARIGASVQRRPSSISKSSSRSPSLSSNSPGEYITINGSEYGFKNRYPNILPYEHSRVRLMPSPMSACSTSFTGEGQFFIRSNSNAGLSPNSALAAAAAAATSTKRTDDYFNANFLSVPQLNQTAKYIATQAPLPATINDFWKVVWHNNVEVIISLTNLDENGMRKSDVYWQESSLVHLVSEEDNFKGIENLTVRTVELTKRGETRTVYQLHLKCWPDFGVVKYTELLDLIMVKDQFMTNADSPLVVHCSAGCGRTGVFITIDLILEAFKKTKCYALSDAPERSSCPIDVWRTEEDLIFFTVQQLRKQRISMVQSLDQFVFCYETILQLCADFEKKPLW